MTPFVNGVWNAILLRVPLSVRQQSCNHHQQFITVWWYSRLVCVLLPTKNNSYCIREYDVTILDIHACHWFVLCVSVSPADELPGTSSAPEIDAAAIGMTSCVTSTDEISTSPAGEWGLWMWRSVVFHRSLRSEHSLIPLTIGTMVYILFRCPSEEIEDFCLF